MGRIADPDRIACWPGEWPMNTERTRVAALWARPATWGQANKAFNVPLRKRGLLIYYGIQAKSAEVVRAVIEHDVGAGFSHGAVRLRGVRDVISLHFDAARAAEATRLHKLLARDAGSAAAAFKTADLMSTDRPYDWSSRTARRMLTKAIEEAGGACVSFPMALGQKADKHSIDMLQQVAEAATGCNALAICFVIGPARHALPLIDVGADSIAVGTCEPSPGATMAFATKSKAGQPYHCGGLGHVMCDLFISAKRAHRIYRPFVAGKLATRFMWHLKARDLSNDDIGQVFGLDDTVVGRRLASIPGPRRLLLPDDWVELYARRLELDVKLIRRLLADPSEG